VTIASVDANASAGMFTVIGFVILVWFVVAFLIGMSHVFDWQNVLR